MIGVIRDELHNHYLLVHVFNGLVCPSFHGRNNVGGGVARRGLRENGGYKYYYDTVAVTITNIGRYDGLVMV